MKKWLISFGAVLALGLGSYTAALGQPGSDGCAPSGALRFLCGMKKPEDLVSLPGGKWLIASGMDPKGGLHLINAKTRRWERWAAAEAHSPTPPYASCPSQPRPNEFQAHGMSLRVRSNGSAVLYVVNHGGSEAIRDFAMGGGRETIEVFVVDFTADKPSLSWIGCIPFPEKLVPNSVASAPDGSVFATVLLHPGDTLSDLWNGKATGAVYKWSPGAVTFERLAGTELVGNNGVEISKDGSKIYIASFSSITMFSNTNPSRRLKSVEMADRIGDNIHWVGNDLIVAGAKIHRHGKDAGVAHKSNGYYVASVHPQTLDLKVIAEGAHNPAFDGVSVGVPVGKTLWLGSHSADRVGYRQVTNVGRRGGIGNSRGRARN